MVKLNVKRGDTSLFLYETTTAIPMEQLLKELSELYCNILKIRRLSAEVEMLAEFGIAKPTQAVGLTDDQIVELKIKDEWTPKCYPSGGSVFNRDVIGRRTGNAPNEKLSQVLKKTCADAKAATSKDQVTANKCLTAELVQDELDKIKGAVMIVYPMGLPPYDEVQHILNGTEDLGGREESKAIITEADAQLWWAGKEMTRGKKLMDFVGKNEKTKIVAKLQKRGGGAPVREPVVDEETQKQMMAYAYKKQQEMKKLEEAEDDAYMNSSWANPGALKNKLQGTGNISIGKLH
eukprot:m.156728 g.156728  ORF g.156728 m.156728 type:complete len:292 (-) comp31020_c0_seq1:67-942(-)